MCSLKSITICFLLILIQLLALSCEEYCNVEDESKVSCKQKNTAPQYSKEANEVFSPYLKLIDDALANYQPCRQKNCSCHADVITQDLAPFKDGISKKMIEEAREKGTKYQIIKHRLYRDAECLFPARCSGVEHFLKPLLEKLPDVELIVNTRDWPQVNRHFGEPLPVFSFSKTEEFLDIMYPAWGFWEGGPAIKLYPRGLGRWDLHRASLSKEAVKRPWGHKKPLAFFRGSRTSGERDALVMLSRQRPDLADAQYTRNQAWKSDADTLHMPPAAEVSLEEHCHYRYLFNFRGVAASFRLKHLFLCRSLVFHVGDEWLEFFYPAMKPWVHYVPVKSDATKEEIRELLEFVSQNQKVAEEIADRGRDFIWEHVRMKDVTCYWEKLLEQYSKLLRFKPKRDKELVELK